MSKHRFAPVIPPESLAQRVPAHVSVITVKMVAKRPDDRFQDMGEVIEAFERFLGIRTSGSYSPGEGEAQTIENAARQYNGVSSKKLRESVLFGLFSLWVVVFVFSALFGGFRLGASALMLGVLTPLFYFVLSGHRRKTQLFARVRELVFTTRISDLATTAVGLLLALGLSLLLGLFLPALLVAVFAAAVAATAHFVLDRRLAYDRRPAVEAVEQLLQRLRWKGVDEESLRMFVAKYSGLDWEELYEELFGYGAKIEARRTLPPGQGERRRGKFRPWRDPLVQWLEGKTNARKHARERKHLERTETAGLQAEGVDLLRARRQARVAASAIVDQAERVRHANVVTAADDRAAAAHKRAMIKAMLHAARTGKGEPVGKSGRGFFSALDILLGAKARFLLGAMLVLGCGVWARQNGWPSRDRLERTGSQLRQAAEQSVENRQLDIAAVKETELLDVKATRPLKLPMAPAAVEDLFRNFQPGVAGLILIATSLLRGRKIYLFAWPAAIVAWLGDRLGVPGLGAIVSPAAVSAGIGLAIGGLGFVFGRSRRN